ncbi:MAG TPA: MlaD family protein [Kofleriaceae bacterium]|nr:MlaD family protein [Kofleriaceae bacterium]
MFQATSAQKMKLGLFLLAAGGLLTVLLVLFAGLSLTSDVDRYRVATADSVSGLRVGATVELRGVSVGQVADVELEWRRPDPVVMTIEVAAGTPIPAGARAVLRMKGVTGLKVVDIEGGDFHGPLRRPGDAIPVGPSALSDITDQGLALVQESRALVKSGARAADRAGDLLGDENRGRVEQILLRGERATADLERAAAQLVETGARLQQVMGGDGARAVADASALLGDARRLMQANRHSITATVDDLREAARSLRHTAELLERDPSRLLFRRKGEERDRR